jgi:hypothetical protein
MFHQCIEFLKREEFKTTIQTIIDICMSSLSGYFVFMYVIILCNFAMLSIILYYTMKKSNHSL